MDTPCRIIYNRPDIPCTCPNVATASLCDGECDACGYIVTDADQGDLSRHVYACTSDQYTHARVYPHGDGCGESDADPDDARHRPFTDGA